MSIRFIAIVIVTALAAGWWFIRRESSSEVFPSRGGKPERSRNAVVLPSGRPRSAQPAPVTPFAVNVISRARQEREPKAALAMLEEAVRREPANSALLAELGFHLLEKIGDRKRALEAFESALILDAGNAEVASAAGTIYVRERLFRRGADFLSSLHHRYPENSTVAVALADLLAKDGRSAEGLRVLEEVRRTSRDADGLSPYLGMMYLNNGLTEKAVEVFKQVLEIREREQRHSPETDSLQVEYARLDVASALLAHGTTAEAEALVRDVLRRYPTDRFATELLSKLTQPSAR